MRSFEIFVGHQASSPSTGSSERGEPVSGVVRSSQSLRRAREVLDVFVEGANVTARIEGSHTSCVLRDLGLALAELARAPRGKALVRFYDDAWELAIERIGTRAMLSVYHGGQDPRVAVYDRAVVFAEVVDSAREAIGAAIARGTAPRAVEMELREAEQALAAIDRRACETPAELPETSLVAVEPERGAPVAFGAEFMMRLGEEARPDVLVERTDLHALLFRGRVRAEVRGRSVDAGEGHPFLFAERAIELSRDALRAWERGRPMNVRVEAGGIVVGLRLSPEGDCALSLGGATFPALSVPDVVEAALSFGRTLVRALVRRDRASRANLRLSALRQKLRDTADHLREARLEDAKINEAPEPYRAFALHARQRGA
jgi:hypothetical protein